MVYHRYGKFCFRDYSVTWVGIAFLIAMMFFAAFLDVSLWIIGYAVVIAAIMLWSVLSPHQERFAINDSTIIITKGKKSRSITIPKEIMIVVSYADVCPLFTKRTAIGNQTHILRDKYAVTILQHISLEDALEHLHRNYVSKYTTSMMEDLFAYKYIYSFVCEQKLLDYISGNRDCKLIIPEALVDMISIKELTIDAYVDAGY